MNGFRVLLIFALLCLPPVGFAQEPPEGVRPLLILKKPIHSVIPDGVVLLEESEVVEKFLNKLEGHIPDWKYLFGKNVDERYDRLFEESEKRDARRIGNPLLTQPIAFLWDGFLTSVRENKPGFAVSMGPRKVQTSWGIVRFKITNLPLEMTAMPPTEVLEHLQQKRNRKEEVAILILFQGRLIPEESLMYDFSTTKEGEGMILPIVELTQVDYILFSEH